MSETREYYDQLLNERDCRIGELEEELLAAQQQLAARDCARSEKATVPIPGWATWEHRKKLNEQSPKLETTCAWCAGELGLAPGERGSTGICERHRAEFIAQAFAEKRQGKRVDQVLFSAAVVLVALALGAIAGAWVAVWRFGAMGVLR